MQSSHIRTSRLGLFLQNLATSLNHVDVNAKGMPGHLKQQPVHVSYATMWRWMIRCTCASWEAMYMLSPVGNFDVNCNRVYELLRVYMLATAAYLAVIVLLTPIKGQLMSIGGILVKMNMLAGPACQNRQGASTLLQCCCSAGSERRTVRQFPRARTSIAGPTIVASRWPQQDIRRKQLTDD